jgi:hypothetical protein
MPRLAFALALLIVLQMSHLRAQVAMSDLHLGFAECAPAIFLPLQPGTAVKVEFTYEDNGMLSSVRQEITREGGPLTTLLVSVDLAKWNGRCSSLAYRVTINDQSIASPAFDRFDKAKFPRTIAFSPAENVGAVVGGGPLESDFRTQVAYDEKNRRYISQQTLGSGGSTFQITFSDYNWTPRGRIAGYTARIREIGK